MTIAEALAALNAHPNPEEVFNAFLVDTGAVVKKVRSKIFANGKAKGMSEAQSSHPGDDAKKTVPDGAVVLEGDDATAWPKLSELLKAKQLATPEALQKVLDRATKADELEAEIGKRDQEKAVADAAKLVDYNAQALVEIARSKGLKLELRDVEVEVAGGKREKKSIPHVVTGEGKDAKAERLTDYAERELAVFLPALKAKPDGSPGRSDSSSGRSYPVQNARTEAPARTDGPSVDALIERNRERASAPNALRPAKKT